MRRSDFAFLLWIGICLLGVGGVIVYDRFWSLDPAAPPFPPFFSNLLLVLAIAALPCGSVYIIIPLAVLAKSVVVQLTERRRRSLHRKESS